MTTRVPGSGPAGPTGQDLTLVVRKTIRADAERVFEAWTKPASLELWWGPGAIRCSGAEIDLRVGGRYRIANEYPDGRVVWIGGEFQVVEPPRRLVYTWRLDTHSPVTELVTIRFEARGAATEVIIMHQRIADEPLRDGHEEGWTACLDGLAAYLETPAGSKDREG